MNIIAATGRLAALPLVWLAELVEWVLPPLAGRIYMLAWQLAADGEIARQALVIVAKSSGQAAALSQALEWMQSRPHPAIAAFGGLSALQLEQPEVAHRLLTEGKRHGIDRDGLLELLEWMVVTRGRMSEAARALAGRLEARHDLPPPLSRAILTTLLWAALQERRFDEALRRAEHLTQVDDTPHAELALWALAQRDRDEHRAQIHLQRAKMDLPQRLYLQVLGSAAVGRPDLAGPLLGQLRQVDAAMADSLDPSLARPAGGLTR